MSESPYGASASADLTAAVSRVRGRLTPRGK